MLTPKLQHKLSGVEVPLFHMKDNFSHGSADYAKFRPSYPEGVFEFLDSVLEKRERVWDCATGNGQVAKELVKLFEQVEATDLSKNQLKNAFLHPNINYSEQVAEQTDFPDDHFDCVTVGQAVHWFDFERFNKEVKRVVRNNGFIVLLGYGNAVFPKAEIQELITRLYKNTLSGYWDAERIYIDEEYQTIPFPFEEITVPKFEASYHWTKEQLLGYLGTWSGLKHYKDATGIDPLIELGKQLPGPGKIEINFPTLFKVGRINK